MTSIVTGLFGSRTEGKVGLVNFDALPTENHNVETEVTDFPVETGVNISDHVRPKADRISLTGVVSDTPIIILASLRAQSPIQGDLTQPRNRAQLAFAELERVAKAGELVTVVTAFKEYENMAIVSISVPRDAPRGNVAEITIELKQVRFAQTERVDAPLRATRPPTSNLGTKPPGAASAGAASQAGSASSALKGLSGLVGF